VFLFWISESGERKRLLDVEAKIVPLHENADHIRSLYSQRIMSAASAMAYGLTGFLMGFVNKVHNSVFLFHLVMVCETYKRSDAEFSFDKRYALYDDLFFKPQKVSTFVIFLQEYFKNCHFYCN